MAVAIITGSAGLIGSEAVRFFAEKGLEILGLDNDMRSYFFGESASTMESRQRLEREVGRYTHFSIDIRDTQTVERLFKRYARAITAVIHTAAQPSHDWAMREPLTDFTVNANGTLNLLDCTRRYAPEATFIFTSTNKVYGDTPNRLPFVELPTRWELSQEHSFFERGIDESMSIDCTLHSLFGASKVAADILVQEYGRYFGMRTVCLRGGCLTGPNHAGVQLHGFLSYLVKCAVTNQHYTVFGYKGKQVRDNIHSYDLVNTFWHFFLNPRYGEVYNIGGGRHSNSSMLEAISACERLTGRPMRWSYCEEHRTGDHIWWITDISRFRSHYPSWDLTYDTDRIIEEIYHAQLTRQPAG